MEMELLNKDIIGLTGNLSRLVVKQKEAWSGPRSESNDTWASIVFAGEFYDNVRCAIAHDSVDAMCLTVRQNTTITADLRACFLCNKDAAAEAHRLHTSLMANLIVWLRRHGV